MSTRLAPWGSGAVEVATQNVIFPGSVGLAQAHPLTRPPAMRKQLSAGLGPVTAHPTHSYHSYPFGRICRWCFEHVVGLLAEYHNRDNLSIMPLAEQGV